MPALSERIRNIVSGGDDGWDLYYRARTRKAAGEPIIMLSIGDHDIKTDPSILDEMDASARRGHLGYAAVPGIQALRKAIAHRVEARAGTPTGSENVIVTSGGQGALFSAMMTVLDPGDACIVLDPYYASFGVTVRAASATPIIVPTSADDGFQPDLDAISAAITPDTRAILVNSPNNPSGAVYRPDRLNGIAQLCKQHDLWAILDELYDCQVHDGAHESIRDLPGMRDRCIQVGSMSKGYAMTGSRLGWAVGPKDAIDRMIDLAGATTYGLPGFIQDAALYALTECAHLEAEVAQRYKRRRDIAVAAIGNASGLRAVPAQGGMYVMLDVRPTGLSGIEFASRLLDEEKIAVMPGESFGRAAAGHVRVALTVPDAELESAMRAVSALATRVAG